MALGLEGGDVKMDDHHACGVVVEEEEEDSRHKIRFALKDDPWVLSLDGDDVWDVEGVERRSGRGVVLTGVNPRPWCQFFPGPLPLLHPLVIHAWHVNADLNPSFLVSRTLVQVDVPCESARVPVADQPRTFDGKT